MSRQIQATRPARGIGAVSLLPERAWVVCVLITSSLPGEDAADEWQDRHTCQRSCQGRRGEYATGVSGLTKKPWAGGPPRLGAVGRAGYGLVSQWPQVRAALGQLDGWDVAGAAACAIAGLGCMMLAWRAL